jgi:rhodanese-related sulfurtransferase
MSILNAKGQNKWGFETMINSLIKNSVDTINSEGVRDLINEGNAVLIDAREKNEYEVSHIEGAVSMGYEKFDMKNLPEIDKDKTIIV